MLKVWIKVLLPCALISYQSHAESNQSSNYQEFLRLRESIAAELQQIRYRVSRTSEQDVPFLRDVDFKLSTVLGTGDSGGDGQKIVDVKGVQHEGPFAFGLSNASKMQARRSYDDLMEETAEKLRRQLGNRLLSFEAGLPKEFIEDGRVRFYSDDSRIVVRKDANAKVHTVVVKLMGERSFGNSNADQRMAWDSFQQIYEQWVESNQRRLQQRYLLSGGFAPSIQSGGGSVIQYEREFFMKFIMNPGEDIFEKREWIQGPEVSGNSNASYRIAYQRYMDEYENWLRQQTVSGSTILFAGPGSMELIQTGSGVSYRSNALALFLLR